MEKGLFVSAAAGRYAFILAVDKPERIKRYSEFGIQPKKLRSLEGRN